MSSPSATAVCDNIYLKFVREGQGEIEILRYLTGINPTSNHIITGVAIWLVRRGNVISMPMAGTWLTEINNRDVQLWSVAKQLFEAIHFMHQHGVTHLDLKPINIIIPVNGGRLTIIDFNRSVHVNGVDDMFSATSALMYIFPLKSRPAVASTAQSMRTCGPVEKHYTTCVFPVGHPLIAMRCSRHVGSL